MGLKSIAVLLVFAVVVRCEDPQRCCWPDTQAEFDYGASLVQVQGGEVIVMQMMMNSAMDFEGERGGSVGTIYIMGQTPIEFKSILLYKEGKQYTIVNGVCQVLPITSPSPKQCIPDDAQFQMYIMQGLNEFEIQQWLLNISDVGLKSGFAFSQFSSKTCVPTGMGYSGITEVGSFKTVLNGGFFNYSSGIPDPKTWFDVPSICNTVNKPVKAKRHTFFDAIKHLRLFGL